jgi:alpha-tubulin suppressor-like RCC1 family protein
MNHSKSISPKLFPIPWPAFAAIAIATGGAHTCALSSQFWVACWGRNDGGQLGIGNTADIGTGPWQMGNSLQRVNLGTGGYPFDQRSQL